jgi:hypothetical protein
MQLAALRGAFWTCSIFGVAQPLASEFTCSFVYTADTVSVFRLPALSASPSPCAAGSSTHTMPAGVPGTALGSLCNRSQTDKRLRVVSQSGIDRCTSSTRAASPFANRAQLSGPQMTPAHCMGAGCAGARLAISSRWVDSADHAMQYSPTGTPDEACAAPTCTTGSWKWAPSHCSTA